MVPSNDEPDFDIVKVEGFPVSLLLENGPVLGIGRAVKRDAVIVKVTTRSGIAGYGEAHHGRAANIVAETVRTILSDIVVGTSALDVVGLWERVYAAQIRSHGLGAAVILALSGLDMALWDIRGKATGWPLYRLLGGGPRSIPAYGGGVALGWQPTDQLIAEAENILERGYDAIKLRVGDTPQRDIERVTAVRSHFGSDLTVMVDANTAYTLEGLRAVALAFEELDVAWIEEPFGPQERERYQRATGLTRIPLAGGENLYTRFDFATAIADRSLGVLQPDVAKVGGVTEFLKVAALTSVAGCLISPHSSVTGLSQAATVHVMSAIDNPGWFEADTTPEDDLRERLTTTPFSIALGRVQALDGPGLSVDVDMDFVSSHPYVPGPNYVKA